MFSGIVTCRDIRYRFGLVMNTVLSVSYTVFSVSFECQGIRHDLAARICRGIKLGSAVIPTLPWVGAIPRYRGHFLIIDDASFYACLIAVKPWLDCFDFFTFVSLRDALEA